MTHEDIYHEKLCWSDDQEQLCQIIETKTIWGETTCRVWLPGHDSVVHVPAYRLKPIESAGAGSPDDIAYVADAAACDSGGGRWP